MDKELWVLGQLAGLEKGVEVCVHHTKIHHKKDTKKEDGTATHFTGFSSS